MWMLSIGLVLAVTITLGNGLCWPEHMQTQFCRADFVVRAKITSTLKFEVPDLPETPTPVVQTTTKTSTPVAQKTTKTSTPVVQKPTKTSTPVAQKTTSKDNNKTKKPSKGVNPKPLRQIAPEPRVRRSLAAPSGMSGGFAKRGYYRVPQYQDVTIKRVLKGVSRVQSALGIKTITVNTTKHTQYVGRVYIGDPGFQLMPGKWYLLSGKVIQNKLWVWFCGLHQEWQRLNLDQLHNLRKDFTRGCKKCRIQYCHPRDLGCEKRNKMNKDTCTWTPDSYWSGADCSFKHSSCQAIKGQCQWKHSPRFDKCKKIKQSKLP